MKAFPEQQIREQLEPVAIKYLAKSANWQMVYENAPTETPKNIQRAVQLYGQPKEITIGLMDEVVEALRAIWEQK